MSDKRVETLSVRRMIWVIIFSLLGTMMMVYLEAYENLHRFMSEYSISGFKEFIVFFPVFIAMGFVLFSAKQVKDLESEIKKRRKTEEMLIESEKRFRKLSITDELTGLFNVRYFFNQLKVEIERTDRYSTPLCLIFVDIDNFKNYNDKYGDLEGDQVLRKIAQAIQSCMRGPDSAYRYGGDEFVGILPETQEQGAAIVAERIRKIVNTHEFLPNPAKAVYMTVSVGFAEYTPGEGAEAFVKRADMNMYVAKNKVYA
ncbi:MAG: GGDEF domain-containing protein [Deltaproteobacteria bacterium]|nr:GGDEF domain-containing protein [Deltaproteobacteria bacterium]